MDQQLGLDITDFVSKLNQVSESLNRHNTAIQKTIATYQQMGTGSTASTQQAAAAFVQMGQAIQGTNAQITTALNATSQVAVKLQNSFNALATSAAKAGKDGADAGGKLYISFYRFMQILEIQVVHRVFGALVTGLQQSINSAVDLQIKISEIRTIAQSSNITFGEFQQTIRGLSESFGTGQLDIAKATYEAFSNQIIKSRSDLSVMNDVLNFSRVASTSATNSVNILSSALNSFNLPVSQAKDVFASLFKAIEVGRFRADDVANSLGRITVTASQVGVSLNEVLALMSTLTIKGVTPAEAQTQIGALLQSFIRPSEVMKNLLKEWGFESGVAAMRTLGFVEVLKRLEEEASKGANRIPDLMHNIRALRAEFGTAAEGGELFRQNLAKISDAQDDYNKAIAIAFESPAVQFQKEIEKIRNFFTNDAANPFIEGVLKMAEPFGGISALFKQVGNAVIDFAGALVALSRPVSELMKMFGALGISLQGVIATYLSAKAGLAIYHATVAAFAPLVAGQAVPAMAALTGVTVGTVPAFGSATVAVTAFGSALKLMLVGTGIGAFLVLTGTLATFEEALRRFGNQFLDTARTARQELDDLSDAQERVRKRQEDQREAENRESTRRSHDFQADVDARYNLIGKSLAAVRQLNDDALEHTRTRLRETTDAFKVQFDIIKSIYSKIISDIKKAISEGETDIKNSRKKLIESADKEAKDLFTRQIQALGTKPQVITSITDYNQEIQARQIAGIEDRNMRNQILAIQGRIHRLDQEARDLASKGDRESIESARRKREEIEHLVSQGFDIETARRRAQEVLAAQLQPGGGGVRAFIVDEGERERRLEQARLGRNEDERVFTRLQARNNELRDEALRKREAEKKVIELALEALQKFSVLDSQSRVRPQFADPTRGPAAARAELQRLEDAANAAIRAGVLTPEQRAPMLQAIADQRRAIEAQVDREITANQLNELEQRFNNERNQIVRMHAEHQTAVTENRGIQRDATRQILDAMTQMVNVTSEEVGRAGLFGGERDRLEGLRKTNAEKIALVREAAVALEAARGTSGEAAAMELFQRRTESANAAYQTFLRNVSRLRDVETGATRSPVDAAGQRVAPDVAAAGLLRTMSNSATVIADSNRQLTEVERENEEAIRAITETLPPALRIAVQTNERLSASILRSFDKPTKAMDEMVKQLGLMTAALANIGRNVPSPARVQEVQNIPGLGEVPILEARAEGGLIGSSFNSYGPDNTIINARTGEFVVNPESTRKFYSTLVALNAGRFPHFAEGGMVGSTNIGDVTVNVNESATPDATARQVVNILKREFRRGTSRF